MGLQQYPPTRDRGSAIVTALSVELDPLTVPLSAGGIEWVSQHPIEEGCALTDRRERKRRSHPREKELPRTATQQCVDTTDYPPLLGQSSIRANIPKL